MKIHVVLKRIFHIVYIVFIREEITGTILQHTGFMVHIDIHKISDFRSTPTYIKIRLLIECCIFEDFFIPVYIRINIGVQIINCTVNSFIRIKYGSCSLIGNRFVVQTHICRSVNDLRFLDRSIHISFYTHANDRPFKITTRFCFNNKYTVGSTSTIHRRCRSILQYREAFYYFRIQRVQVCFRHFNSV